MKLQSRRKFSNPHPVHVATYDATTNQFLGFAANYGSVGSSYDRSCMYNPYQSSILPPSAINLSVKGTENPGLDLTDTSASASQSTSSGYFSQPVFGSTGLASTIRYIFCLINFTSHLEKAFFQGHALF